MYVNEIKSILFGGDRSFLSRFDSEIDIQEKKREKKDESKNTKFVLSGRCCKLINDSASLIKT